MKSADDFFAWAFNTRANTVMRLYNGEDLLPEKIFFGFCSHTPAFVSNGPAGLNASIKGVGFLPKPEYLEETLRFLDAKNLSFIFDEINREKT
ncbi:MAG: hypothetical protein IH571_06950 [Acholeplasmataceae bacterium]|nr:hypothetical protein [Acholeplasmataceae bacterium]